MAQINKREHEFRQMLTQLASMITGDELEKMKYQSLSAGITRAAKDKIKSSLDLWEKLEERGHLGPDKLKFLYDLLTTCTSNRTDVVLVVKKYEGAWPANRPADGIGKLILT